MTSSQPTPDISAPMGTWLSEPMPSDVSRALERVRRAPGVERVAVMPDVHLAHGVCIGTVVATSSVLYPEAVGGDIGCGMAAIAFDAGADLIADERPAAWLLDALYRAVPTRRHRRRPEADDLPGTLFEAGLSAPSLNRLKGREGTAQLGTLGSGNHFLEFQADNEGRLWLMLHSGSRAMGQAIRDHHLKAARPTSAGLRAIEAHTPAGQAYLADMDWALKYAQANRDRMIEVVCDVVEALFGAEPLPESHIDCHHNHVRLENHAGRDLWVHRKGAIPALEGEMGIIPGSMGTFSYHVVGRGNSEALCSSSHGAGRAMSRSEARRRFSVGDLHRQAKGIWFDRRMAHGLRDEAPRAYKDITAVMRAQKPLTRIVRRLRPLLSFKGL